MSTRPFTSKTRAAAFALTSLFVLHAAVAIASDHLDTPTVAADPRSDIGDLYGWTSGDGTHLNLVMTIVGHTFSDQLDYVFHIDSGPRLGATTATHTLECTFKSKDVADCRLDEREHAVGNASVVSGIESTHRRFRVFAGLRDDPFFNNVKGSRDAFDAAAGAILAGTPADASGCPQFDAPATQTIRERWRHTQGGAPKNFLEGWSVSAIVVSIDLRAVATGGRLLGVWAATVGREGQIDRAGRPLTGNALLAPLAADVGDRLKEAYNRATPATSARFVADIQKSLALYDGYDGHCGNQLLYQADVDADVRYLALATLLADDRLWIDSGSRRCTQLFGVELAQLAGRKDAEGDCGGRTPNYDAANVYRSLLVDGTTTGVDDGLHHDEREQSDRVFPFLAAPGDASIAGASYGAPKKP